MAGLRLGLDYLAVTIDGIADTLQVDLLEKRRKFAGIVFLFMLIYGDLDWPALVVNIDLMTR